MENSVGCLSEKRLFTKRVNKEGDEVDSSRIPSYFQHDRIWWYLRC